MGKPRLSELSEEERIRVLRQVTRELNEAAQNARDAGRQLTAAYNQTAGSIEKTMQTLVDKEAADLKGWIAETRRALNEKIAVDEQKTRDHYARLLGAIDYVDLIQDIIDQVYATVIPELNRVLRTIPGAASNIQIQPVANPERPGKINVIDEATYRRRLKDGTLAELGTIIDGRRLGEREPDRVDRRGGES